MMFLSTVILVGLALRTVAAEVPSEYTPRLTSENIGGRITASTFVLDQPRCVFNDAVNATDEIWLLVARSNALNNFTLPRSPNELPYQQFEKNSFYTTLNTIPANYPCPDPAQPSNQLAILRVGNEVKCASDPTRPDCNGPLPGPGPYRVKFLAFNSEGVTAETKWSSEIPLTQGKNPATIDTWPGRRSAGMIVITTILSILSAILVAALIAALLYKYSDVCGSADIVSVRDLTITRYTTHHIYDQPAQKL
ncbi:uroplakin-3b-like [Sceloporus undulatus]|uniref:uroplakin-3b-like n=1 Tax=Sceloporus undulatus TaxID=8520 RepID=UPI001C4D3741|nr:uroplakin-3b-like [Sceloporus undulatus]